MSDCDDKISHISSGSYGQITILDNNSIIKTTKKLNSSNNYSRQNIQEAVFLSTIKHENIVEAKNIYILGDEINIEQERGECTLHDFINKNDRDSRLKHLDYIIFQLVSVLYFLHKSDLIHGDLKPNNILISSKNLKIKLIDFGGICSFRLNNNHKTICTPSFCPPEGWKQLNINCLNTKFDIWSLGMVIYFYITRTYLLDFEEDKTIYYVNEFKWSFDKNYHHNIDKIKKYIDNSLFNLIEKMLMYDPDDRISSDELYFDEYFSEYNIDTIVKFKFQSEFSKYFMENYTHKEWQQRDNLIEWCYIFCRTFEMRDHLVLSIWILDNYLNKARIKITSRNYKLYGYCSIFISSILIANKILDNNKTLIYIPKYISKKNIYDTIDNIMMTLNFKLYITTFDYLLKNNKIQLEYQIIKTILKDKKYIGVDQKILMDIYLEKLTK